MPPAELSQPPLSPSAPTPDLQHPATPPLPPLSFSFLAAADHTSSSSTRTRPPHPRNSSLTHQTLTLTFPPCRTSSHHLRPPLSSSLRPRQPPAPPPPHLLLPPVPSLTLASPYLSPPPYLCRNQQPQPNPNTIAVPELLSPASTRHLLISFLSLSYLQPFTLTVSLQTRGPPLAPPPFLPSPTTSGLSPLSRSRPPPSTRVRPPPSPFLFPLSHLPCVLPTTACHPLFRSAQPRQPLSTMFTRARTTVAAPPSPAPATPRSPRHLSPSAPFSSSLSALQPPLYPSPQTSIPVQPYLDPNPTPP